MSDAEIREALVAGRHQIVLCGAHGVGKSTLGRALAERLGVPFKDGITRKVLEKNGFQTARAEMTPQIRARVQKSIMESWIVAYCFGGVKAFTRSPLDVLAYSVLKADGSKEMDELVRSQREIVNGFISNRSEPIYILVPPNIPLVADGVREAGEAQRFHVHLLVRGLLAEYGVPHLVIESSDPAERIEEALFCITAEMRQRAIEANFLERSVAA